MNIRLLGLIAACLLAANTITACAAAPEENEIGGQDEVSLSRALAVLAVANLDGYPDNLISAAELQALLNSPAASSLFLLDTRPRQEWDEQGHIAGAVSLSLQTLADPDVLALLPQDKLIVCISPTGHTGVQAAAVLRWLGYRAITLKHGMAAWTPTPAGRLMVDEVEMGASKSYPVVKKDSPGLTLPLPLELSPPPADQFELLRQAAAALLHEDVFEKEYPFNHIFADQLYQRLWDPTQREGIYLLDIRPEESWATVGMVDGANLVDWRLLSGHCQLTALPRDQLIVVIGETGQTAGQVTPILRMLGYNAVTLRSGMTAWTQTPDSAATLATIESAVHPVVR